MSFTRAAPSLIAFVACLASSTLTLNARAADVPAESAATQKLVSDLGLQVDKEPVRNRSGWTPPRKILVSSQLHERLAELQEVAPGVKFIEYSTNTPARDIAEADAAIGVCSSDILAKAKKLKWIQWMSAGAERCVQEPLVRERRPLVTNMQRTTGGTMAEHVMGVMLMLSRSLNFFVLEQQRGHWAAGSDDRPVTVDLDGKTILVVGLGGIGTEVAKRAHSFGMRVIATRASGRTGPDYVSYVGLPDELLTLAKQADYIVNCAPLTPTTQGVFNAQFFAAMKPTAYFVSVGRGRSTVTADLIAALNDKKIAGAALDVTDPEPLPADSALWRMPNVIITPHVSAETPVAYDMRFEVARENVRRYVAGEPMLSVVDIDRGY